MRIYMAGPDVFFPEPLAWAARKQAICRAHGVVGVSPFDPVDIDTSGLSAADAIAARNEAHLRRVDAVIANLTPFRGPSADVGTAYEVGFARALGLPVFGYTAVAAGLLARTRAAVGGMGTRDGAGLEIEDFGLRENLMIDAGVRAAGAWVAADVADPWSDLTLFTRCVVLAAR